MRHVYHPSPNDPYHVPDNPHDREPVLDLHSKGYSYSYGYKEWERTVSSKRRTARRDHKDGTVLKGDVYYETVQRVICDETNEVYLRRSREVIKLRPEEG